MMVNTIWRTSNGWFIFVDQWCGRECLGNLPNINLPSNPAVHLIHAAFHEILHRWATKIPTLKCCKYQTWKPIIRGYPLCWHTTTQLYYPWLMAGISPWFCWSLLVLSQLLKRFHFRHHSYTWALEETIIASRYWLLTNMTFMVSEFLRMLFPTVHPCMHHPNLIIMFLPKTACLPS